MSDTCISQIESHWKIKTTISNNLFHKCSYQEALLSYEEALYRAEVLNHHYQDCLRNGIPFIQIYITSCTNIAHTQSALHAQDKAEEMLKRVLYYLLHLSKIKDLDPMEIKRELKRALVYYYDFVRQGAQS